MLGADSFVSALLRVVTTVAILAAVYFFIVKPVLDTTESVSHDINRAVNPNRAIESVNRSIRRANIQSERRTRRALRHAHAAIHEATHGSARSALPPIVRCIQRANGDVAKIEACSR
jgi:hypothetical protein